MYYQVSCLLVNATNERSYISVAYCLARPHQFSRYPSSAPQFAQMAHHALNYSVQTDALLSSYSRFLTNFGVNYHR